MRNWVCKFINNLLNIRWGGGGDLQSHMHVAFMLSFPLLYHAIIYCVFNHSGNMNKHRGEKE